MLSKRVLTETNVILKTVKYLTSEMKGVELESVG